MRGLGQLAAGDAHMARYGWASRLPIDDEIMALRLADNGIIDRVHQVLVMR